MNRYFNRCSFCCGVGLKDVEWDLEGEPTKSLPCGDCDGLGMHLTEEGEEIREFFERIAHAEGRKS